ncbi:MAG: electron transfer flavoprotein subunit alpha/FixB family protein [Chloroflexi bacterium]|nr:electron transfer flavoprotein subunit alpha/FixB family protein [Chloroflexota bacterium]
MSNDVFVVVEHLKGRIGDTTFEMLGQGREIADTLGGKLYAVLIGSQCAGLADELGKADGVLCVADVRLANFNPTAYKHALGELVRERAPRLLLVGNTSMGMDLAAGVSALLSIPLVAYCNRLRVEDGKIVATAQIYGGKLFADAEAAGDQMIVSVLAGSFSADAGKATGTAPVEELKAPLAINGGGGVRFKQLIEPEAADVDITKQDVLVSVGRGIQSADNLELVEELANALGGALSSSRPIVDNGWLPKARQVGKSGSKVKPKLYLAVGISGAPEHLEGMRDAGLIIAINSDPQAPIFDVAHYGIAADLFDVVPALTEKIKAAA